MSQEVPPFDSDFWNRQLGSNDSSYKETVAEAWKVNELPLGNERNSDKLYRLSKGFLDIDLEARTDSILIKWDSAIPSMLSPGQGHEKLFDLIDLITDEIPRKFRPDPDTSEEQSRNQHRNLTKIKLETRDGNNPWMRLVDEHHIAELAVEFASPKNLESAVSLHVIGSKYLLKNNYSYLLAVYYPQLESTGAGQVRIQIPMNPNINSSLNQDAMEWILQTHYHMPSLDDIQSDAKELSEVGIISVDKWAIGKGII